MWWYFDNPEDQLWRHFSNLDNLWWRHFEDPCYESWLPHDYSYDVTDDPCDRIDDLPQKIATVKQQASDKKYGSVMAKITKVPNWWPNRSSVMTHVTPNDDTWWSKWLQKMTLTTLMTLVDYHRHPMWQPVDDEQKFLMTSDNVIWQYLLPKSKIVCLDHDNNEIQNQCEQNRLIEDLVAAFFPTDFLKIQRGCEIFLLQKQNLYIRSLV